MRPIIMIPARMASTRLPDKPLAMIGDAPMIVQVWRRAMEAKAGEVVVACDGKKIAEAITKAGGRAVLTDPELPSGSDRIFSALRQIDAQGDYDVVINVQGDMPTLDPAVIRQAVAVMEKSQAEIVTLAAEIHDEAEKSDPAVVKAVMSHESLVIGNNPAPMTHDQQPMANRALDFTRTATASRDGRFYHHIGLYAYRRAALEKFVSLPPSPREKKEKLEQLRALEAGMSIAVGVVDTIPLGVDTPQTLEKARSLLCQN